MTQAGGTILVESELRQGTSFVISLPRYSVDSEPATSVRCLMGEQGEASTRFLAERLAAYKLPRSFEYVATPLRDDAGKVRRSALRAERMSG